MRLCLLFALSTLQFSYQSEYNVVQRNAEKIKKIDCTAIADGYRLAQLTKYCTTILAANVSAWSGGVGLLYWNDRTQEKLSALISTVEEIRCMYILVNNTNLRTLYMHFQSLKRFVCEKRTIHVPIRVVGNKNLTSIHISIPKMSKSGGVGLCVMNNPNLAKEEIAFLRAQHPGSIVRNCTDGSKPSGIGTKSSTVRNNLISTSALKSSRLPVATRKLDIKPTRLTTTTKVTRKTFPTKPKSLTTTLVAARKTDTTASRTTFQAPTTLTTTKTDATTSSTVAVVTTSFEGKTTTGQAKEVETYRKDTSSLILVTTSADTLVLPIFIDPAYATTTAIKDDDASGKEHLDEYDGEENRPYAPDFDIPIDDAASYIAINFSFLLFIVYKTALN